MLYTGYTFAGILLHKTVVQRDAESVAEINLVRLYYDGKLADNCNIVEIVNYSGKTHYRDLRSICLDKELFKERRFNISLPIIARSQRFHLSPNETMSKNRELLTQILLYDKLILTKTVEVEESQRSKRA